MTPGVAAVVCLLTIQSLLRAPDSTLAWRAIFNAGHVPLFGAISLAVLRSILNWPLKAQTPRPLAYAQALVLTLLLGALSELSQVGADRDRSLLDLARNAAGVVSFLCFAATVDPEMRASAAGTLRRVLYRTLAVALLAVALVPAALVAHAYAQRDKSFPRLFTFGASWSSYFFNLNEAHLELKPVPGRQDRAARITFLPGPSPGLQLVETYPNWTGYSKLRIVLFSEIDHETSLILRVHDRWHDDRIDDRFNRALAIPPGFSEFEIPLLEIREGPVVRQLDMTAIRGVTLFALHPAEAFQLYLVDIRLH